MPTSRKIKTKQSAYRYLHLLGSLAPRGQLCLQERQAHLHNVGLHRHNLLVNTGLEERLLQGQVLLCPDRSAELHSGLHPGDGIFDIRVDLIGVGCLTDYVMEGFGGAGLLIDSYLVGVCRGRKKEVVTFMFKPLCPSL